MNGKVKLLLLPAIISIALFTAVVIIASPAAAQTPPWYAAFPVRIIDGSGCNDPAGVEIPPDADGHWRLHGERTASGCCTTHYYHWCEWPRGETVTYTAGATVIMHSAPNSWSAEGRVSVPYNNGLVVKTGQSTGIYDLQATTIFTRNNGTVDTGNEHRVGWSLNGPSTATIDIWIDGYTIDPGPLDNLCTDGTEVVSSPVYLTAGEAWASDQITTSWNYLQARYTISNAGDPSGTQLAGLATLNGSDWLWGPQSNADIISVTVPSSIGYDEEPNGPDVELGIRNTSDSFYLVSACIVPYSGTMVPQSCNLVNHSFADGTTGWQVLDGLYTYLGDEEDGAVSLESIGMASQVVTLTGSFKLQVRARSSGSSSQFRFGAYELGYPFESTAVTETTGTAYEIYEGYVYLNGRSNISIVSNDNDTIIDWVCLSGHDTGGLPYKFPIPDCTFPPFDDHPDFSITEIGNWIVWLAETFGELVQWLVCEIFVVLFTIANTMLDAIRALGDFTGLPDFPAFPDEITFDSILEWLRQTYVAFWNWIWLNLRNARNSVPMLFEWLWGVLVAVLSWIGAHLFAPAISWLMEHVLEALGIGDDVIEIVRTIWRDLSLFVAASALEAEYEFEALTTLLTETAGIFGVLLTGFRGVATGSTELDFGESLGGLAAYLWRGAEFINDSVSSTPLAALNIVALGIITIGLAQWTIHKLVTMLERLS